MRWISRHLVPHHTSPASAAAAAAAAAAASAERPDQVFDIVLPSPTGPPPAAGGSGASTPASTSGGGSWSMSSSTDGGGGGGGTVCYGDERAMLTELGRRFYNRRALSDVKLRVGERVYCCHKLLLALSSDVLERMLCSADWTDAVKQASSFTPSSSSSSSYSCSRRL